jgi:hypothetical protein
LAGGTAAVDPAVAGDIDDMALAFEAVVGEERRGVEQRVADSGAAAEGERARQFEQFFGKGFGVVGTVDQAPVDNDLLHLRAGPFDEHHGDALKAAAADGVDDALVAESLGIALAL